MKATNYVTNHESFELVGDINAKCILPINGGDQIEVPLSYAQTCYTACQHVDFRKLEGALNSTLPEKLHPAAQQVLSYGVIHNAIIAPEWREAVAKLIQHNVVKAHWGNTCTTSGALRTVPNSHRPLC